MLPVCGPLTHLVGQPNAEIQMKSLKLPGGMYILSLYRPDSLSRKKGLFLQHYQHF